MNQLRHGYLSEDPKLRKAPTKINCLNTFIKIFENRNFELQSQEKKLKQRLQLIEKLLPSLLLSQCCVLKDPNAILSEHSIETRYLKVSDLAARSEERFKELEERMKQVLEEEGLEKRPRSAGNQFTPKPQEETAFERCEKKILELQEKVNQMPSRNNPKFSQSPRSGMNFDSVRAVSPPRRTTELPSPAGRKRAGVLKQSKECPQRESEKPRKKIAFKCEDDDQSSPDLSGQSAASLLSSDTDNGILRDSLQTEGEGSEFMTGQGLKNGKIKYESNRGSRETRKLVLSASGTDICTIIIPSEIFVNCKLPQISSHEPKRRNKRKSRSTHSDLNLDKSCGDSEDETALSPPSDMDGQRDLKKCRNRNPKPPKGDMFLGCLTESELARSGLDEITIESMFHQVKEENKKTQISPEEKRIGLAAENLTDSRQKRLFYKFNKINEEDEPMLLEEQSSVLLYSSSSLRTAVSVSASQMVVEADSGAAPESQDGAEANFSVQGSGDSCLFVEELKETNQLLSKRLMMMASEREELRKRAVTLEKVVKLKATEMMGLKAAMEKLQKKLDYVYVDACVDDDDDDDDMSELKAIFATLERKCHVFPDFLKTGLQSTPSQFSKDKTLAEVEGIPSTCSSIVADKSSLANKLNLRVLRKLEPDSLLIDWTVPSGVRVAGYEIFVNGQLHQKVRNPMRNVALLERLDLSSPIVILLYVLTPHMRVL